MCRCVKYSEIKNEIQQHLKKRMLIPVIGSGFTRGCKSCSGEVPSGHDYKIYMIDEIIKRRGDDSSKKESLEKIQFSKISTIYHKIIPKENQDLYLRDKFTKVILPDEKKEFLNIDWPYIYTLNTDDAIESNSKYNHVIISNRETRDEIFDEEKCIIKLHGDVKDILSYADSRCEIFDQIQYVNSLRDNKVLLDKLRHDYEYLNLLYIGCSLSDEIDILSAISNTLSNGSHYFCTIEQPNEYDLIFLEEYGITHCILFDSFDDIYHELALLADETNKIDANELDKYKTYNFSVNSDGFEENKDYLFHGKNPVNKERKVILPSFFVSRDITDNILKNIKTKGTQILVGPGCSGKTYVTLDIARRVADKDVFVFQSRERVNEEAFSILIHRDNCLVITDSKALSIQQIEEVIRTEEERIKHNNSFVIVENKSNRDLSSLLSLLTITEVVKSEELATYDLKNKFSEKRNDELNLKLVKSSLSIFSNTKSIADNIIDISSRLIQKNQFEKIAPKTGTIKEVASLVALATMEKIYSEDVVILNLEEEFMHQKKKAFPLIDDEGTWDFEKTAAKNSPMKYVINAEFWLYRQLNDISKTKVGREKIVSAYRYIVPESVKFMVFLTNLPSASWFHNKSYLPMFSQKEKLYVTR